MTTIVIDASVVVSTCFDDEASAVADLPALVESRPVRVPPIFRFELTNAIAIGMRTGRIADDRAQALLDIVLALDWRIDHPDPIAFSVMLELARRHRLTIYDAAYLELAMREMCPLATRDDALARAARSEGVVLVTFAN